MVELSCAALRRASGSRAVVARVKQGCLPGSNVRVSAAEAARDLPSLAPADLDILVRELDPLVLDVLLRFHRLWSTNIRDSALSEWTMTSGLRGTAMMCYLPLFLFLVSRSQRRLVNLYKPLVHVIH